MDIIADATTELLMQILLFGGMAVFLGSPIVIIFFLRDKIASWPGRTVISIPVYKAKNGVELTDTGHIDDKDVELAWTGKGWKLMKNKIPYIYIDYGFLKGFTIDAVGLTLLKRLPGPTLRLLELAPNVREASNYRFMDVPDKLDYRFVSSSITAMAKSLRESVRAEFARPKNESLWRDIIVPIISLIIAALIVILALNWGAGTIDKSTAFASNTINAACYNACHVPLNETPGGANAQAPKPPTTIPFIQGP